MRIRIAVEMVYAAIYIEVSTKPIKTAPADVSISVIVCLSGQLVSVEGPSLERKTHLYKRCESTVFTSFDEEDGLGG